MSASFHLFRRTKELEHQIDKFFDSLTETAVVFRLAVRLYIREGANEEFKERLDNVSSIESEADHLRRDIERQLYANTLIPDSRGDVLGLIETVDQLLSEMEGTLWSFWIEKPEIPEEYISGFRKLTNMVIRAVDELGLGARAFFRSPHDVPSYNHKVILYEKEADVLSTTLKTEIFASDMELIQKIHLRQFADKIDRIANVAEDVADRLAIYAIKRMA